MQKIRIYVDKITAAVLWLTIQNNLKSWHEEAEAAEDTWAAEAVAGTWEAVAVADTWAAAGTWAVAGTWEEAGTWVAAGTWVVSGTWAGAGMELTLMVLDMHGHMEGAMRMAADDGMEAELVVAQHTMAGMDLTVLAMAMGIMGILIRIMLAAVRGIRTRTATMARRWHLSIAPRRHPACSDATMSMTAIAFECRWHLNAVGI